MIHVINIFHPVCLIIYQEKYKKKAYKMKKVLSFFLQLLFLAPSILLFV